MTGRSARTFVWVASRLVPRDRREDWLEEWRGELAALEQARATGARGLPGSLAFAAGALPHAMWTRTEEWTMESVVQDLRYSARVLRRAPGFTLVAAATLALGIAANASIFSLVNGLVLRAPAGVHEPDRLVQIARSYESAPRWDVFSWPAMKLIGTEARALSGVAGYQTQPFVLGRGAETERVLGQLVTGNYFEVLGVTPFLGRLLRTDDDVEPGAHPVVVLSHALWTRRYGADRAIIGSTLEIGSRPYEVIGVTPPGFQGIESIGTPPAVFVPAMMHPGYGGERFEEWGASWINVAGRLAEGVSFEEARASMDVVTARLRAAAPAVHEDIEVLLAEGVGLDPEGRREAEQVSAILLLIVGLVLLLTCTNVANLFMARATARRSEVGVRVAMGAGRVRLARQHLTESTLVAVAATLLAVPVVLAAGDLVPLVFPYTLAVSVGADARVWAFLLVIGLGAGLLFGAAPAWTSSRRDVVDMLREGASTGARARTRLRDALVVSQLGLSLALVAGAALLGRSVMNARNADPGFEPTGLAAAYVDLFTTGRYDEERGRALLEGLIAEAERRPDTRAVTIANQVPIAGGHSRASVRPADHDDEDFSFEAEYIVVGPRYFETMGVPIARGRALGGFGDEPEPVVVVNEALASLFWPGEDPIGRDVSGPRGTWRVVGLVPDVQMRSLRARANPAVYYPSDQIYAAFVQLLVSSESGRVPTAETMRSVVATLDPELPVSTVLDLEAAMVDSMAETRTIGYLVSAFAALAILLAAVGLYGLVSYGAAQRVREIGIRIALGARPESLVRLILARGLAIALLGIGVGFAIAYGLGLALQSLLFGVAPTDVPTLGAAALVLALAAGLAAWVPAHRASRTDAAVSLRD
jgi:predicted permease